MRDLLGKVRERGWSVLTTGSIAEFRSLGQTLGRARSSRLGGPDLEHLRVVSQENARPHSHSAIHGRAAIPFHTDAAHWAIPPRYVVLRSENQTGRATEIIDGRNNVGEQSNAKLLERAVFVAINGRRSFLTSAWNPTVGFLRWDPSCMRAADRTARQALAMLERELSRAHVDRICWNVGTTLVVDNWRCMHARAGEQTNDD